MITCSKTYMHTLYIIDYYIIIKILYIIDYPSGGNWTMLKQGPIYSLYKYVQRLESE